MSHHKNSTNSLSDKNPNVTTTHPTLSHSTTSSDEELYSPAIESKVLKPSDLKNAFTLGLGSDDEDWAKMIESLISPRKDHSFEADFFISESTANSPTKLVGSEKPSIDTNGTTERKPSTAIPIPLTAHQNPAITSLHDTRVSTGEQARDNGVKPQISSDTRPKPAPLSSMHSLASSDVPDKTPVEAQSSCSPATSALGEPKIVSSHKLDVSTVAFAEAKEELKREKIKRVNADMLLIKLFKELQKLKLVTLVYAKSKDMEDITVEIAALEQRKAALEKVSNTSMQFNSLDQILSKIESISSSEAMKPELVSLVNSIKTEVLSQQVTIKSMKIEIDFLTKSKDERTAELKKVSEELETTKNILLDIKVKKIDELSQETVSKIDPKLLQMQMNEKSVENTPIVENMSPTQLRSPTKRSSVSGRKTWTKDLKSGLAKVTGQLSNKNDDTTASDANPKVHIERPYHKFLPHTYKVPKKCDVCEDTMWGKELKCETCSFHSHQACSNNAGICGNKKTKGDTLLFGVELSQVVDPSTNIPYFVSICIQIVEEKGMEMEGVYRKSGPGTKVNALISMFNSRRLPTLEEVNKEYEVTAITSALKQFLRELPNSLIDTQYHKILYDSIKKPAPERKEAINKIIKQLTPPNYETLAHLIRHLARVQTFSSKNLMVSNNLGVVFGPTIMKSDDVSLDITDSPLKVAIVEFLIDNSKDIF